MRDILELSGLSSRSFYRHFESKEHLFRVLNERHSRRLAARILERMTPGSPARVQLENWLRETLASGLGPGRAEVLAIAAARLSDAERPCYELGDRPAVDLLERILARGRGTGVFPTARPAADARLIHRLAAQVVTLAGAGDSRRAIDEGLEQLLRFVLPALGWTDDAEEHELEQDDPWYWAPA